MDSTKYRKLSGVVNKNWSVIRNGLVIDPNFRSCERSDILIYKGKIKEINQLGMPVPEGSKEIEADGYILMPGLINAHTHGHGSLGKGLGDRWALEHLLHAGSWLNDGRLLEDKRLSANLNAVEMVLKGCTASYDLYSEVPMASVEGIEAVAAGYEDIGVRSTIAPMMADITLYKAIPEFLEAFPYRYQTLFSEIQASPTEKLLNTCKSLLHKWPFDIERSKVALAPTVPLFCTDQFLLGCRDLSDQFEVGLHMHLSESRIQAVKGIQNYGKTLTNHLDQLGLITENFTGAHCVWMDGDDIIRLADKGANVAHNPCSNLRLGNGIAPVHEMRTAGINVGIGTDGSHCSDHQNMFENIRLASLVSRNVNPDTESWIEASDVLKMATSGSAQALGFGKNIGKLQPGYHADIIFLDLKNINFVPLNNPVNQIVYSEDGSSVDSVMVDGEFILLNRKFTKIDYNKLCYDAQNATERLKAYNYESQKIASFLESYISQFCVDFACKPFHVNRYAGNVQT